jgi:hypothetical protein
VSVNDKWSLDMKCDLTEIEQDYEDAMRNTTDLEQQYKLAELINKLERDYYTSPNSQYKSGRIYKLYQKIIVSKCFG